MLIMVLLHAMCEVQLRLHYTKNIYKLRNEMRSANFCLKRVKPQPKMIVSPSEMAEQKFVLILFLAQRKYGSMRCSQDYILLPTIRIVPTREHCLGLSSLC